MDTLEKTACGKHKFKVVKCLLILLKSTINSRATFQTASKNVPWSRGVRRFLLLKINSIKFLKKKCNLSMIFAVLFLILIFSDKNGVPFLKKSFHTLISAHPRE